MNRKQSKNLQRNYTEVEAPTQLSDDLEFSNNDTFGLGLTNFSKLDEILYLSSPQYSFHSTVNDSAPNSKANTNQVDNIFQRIFGRNPIELSIREKSQQLDPSLETKCDQFLFEDKNSTEPKTSSFRTQGVNFNQNCYTETVHRFKHVFEECIELEQSKPEDLIFDNLSRVYSPGENFVPMVNLSSSIPTGLLKYISVLHHQRINEADLVIYSEDTFNVSKGFFHIRLGVFRREKLIATVKSPQLNKTILFRNIDKDLLESITTYKHLETTKIESEKPLLFNKLREINKCADKKSLKKEMKKREWRKIKLQHQDVIKYLKSFVFSKLLDKYFLGSFLANKIKKQQKFNTEYLGRLLASDTRILHGVSETEFYQILVVYLNVASLELTNEDEKYFMNHLYESLSRCSDNYFSDQDLSSQIAEVADLILKDMSLRKHIYKAIYMLANRKNIYKKLKQLVVTRLIAKKMKNEKSIQGHRSSRKKKQNTKNQKQSHNEGTIFGNSSKKKVNK